MTNPADAVTIAQLEQQCRSLTALLVRLERARADLIPIPGTVWSGLARRAYDAAVESIALAAEATSAAIRSARDYTRTALDVLTARG